MFLYNSVTGVHVIVCGVSELADTVHNLYEW